ncbi:MAG: bifunctional alpha,alpha-trehalose-phosphate synthase (UDP-forming)/trehalose-phosphatase [Bacteroidales bacterium]
MARIFIVSNRLPVKTEKNNKGEITVSPASGGLATGMKSVYKKFESLWFGWSGMYQDELEQSDERKVKSLLKREGCVAVPLTRQQIDDYYYGFSNKTLWPLFHYFTQYAQYDEDQWDAYQMVNQVFADTLKPYLRQGDKIWIHDYHLFLLPRLIRSYMPTADIAFFLHIPFPSSEVFRQLPWRDEILKGMLGADLIGFHTYDYERHFMSSVRRQLGYENTYNRIRLEDRVMKVDAFPMGIDFEKFSAAAREEYGRKESSTDVGKNMHQFFNRRKGNKMILSMDRLDYSKGIYNRLMAFEKYLEQHPEKLGAVSLFMLAVPSRTSVDHYQRLKSEIDEAVGRINSKFGTVDWMPIWYFFRSMPFEQLVELYVHADIALITPIRDGMNLIAKEYLACRTDYSGVLILSEMAGAAKELGEASIVNPNDIQLMADAIHEAVHMPKKLQKSYNKMMIDRLRRYDVTHWANDFMDAWSDVKKMQEEQKTREIQPLIRESISRKYQKAKARLLLLDYDGTLVSFKSDPHQALMDEAMFDLLETMQADPINDVYIMSGRSKNFMDKYFGKSAIGLVAEHGVWTRKPGKEWKKAKVSKEIWKEEIKEVLQIYADRTPGSFVEEKDSSLSWHYRKADPDLGDKRAWELNDGLRDLLGNQNLEVLEGKKVVEIKQVGLSKGSVAEQLIRQKEYDFLFAMGDDRTDEYMFQAVGNTGISVKIGLEQTMAHYYIDTAEKVYPFLTRMVKAH